MIKLGNKVKDIVTGFTGIVVARTEWLHGCVRIGVQSKELHEGKPIEAEWFDEQRCELVEETKPAASKDSSAKTGGPQRDPRLPSGR